MGAKAVTPGQLGNLDERVMFCRFKFELFQINY